MRRKHLSLLLLVITALSIKAQRNDVNDSSISIASTQEIEVIEKDKKAANDTLFLFEGSYIVGTGFSNTSTPPFDYIFQDIDNKTIDSIYTNIGYLPKSSYVISFRVSGTNDTNYFFTAFSYFTPPGVANDWLSFGPISIPANGATLSWKHCYSNVDFRDGYKVHVNTAGIGAGNFTGSPIYTVLDNDPSTATDTAFYPSMLFYPRSVDLSAYAGQDIYVGIQHDANDMDRFFLDDILIVEKSATDISVIKPIEEVINVYPNPSSGTVELSFQNNVERMLEVYDATGAIVYSGRVTSSRTIIDLSDLLSGVYLLKAISVSGTIATKQLVIN